MLEVFAHQVLLRLRGTGDVSRPQDAGTHPHQLKWKAMSALFASPDRLAGLYSGPAGNLDPKCKLFGFRFGPLFGPEF